MPIGTGYTPIPQQTLPVVIAPVDGTAAGQIVMPVVTLGGQVLNSPQTDVYGIAWVVTAIDGWDSPDVRLTQTPRSFDHGLFVEPAFFGGRLLIVHGKFFAASPLIGTQALMAAKDRLKAAWTIMGGALSPLVVAENPPKMALVQRLAGCKCVPSNAVTFDFEAHLLAPDPRLVDPTPTTTVVQLNNTVTVTNYGSFESRPVITVAGPCNSVNLLNLSTGQTLTFSQNLISTDLFTVNLDLKSATLNGNPVTATITSAPSQWWVLQPGANVISFPGSGGAAIATILSRSAWA